MFKSLLLASVFVASMVVESTPTEAEACGLNMGVRSSAKGKPPTSGTSDNPSSILIVGSHDRALIRNLRSARHRVEYASSVEEAKRSKYRLVVVDDSQVDAARERFTSAQIIMHKDRGTSQIVEVALARRAASARRSSAPSLASRPRFPVTTGGEGLDETGRTAAGSGSEAPTDRVALTQPRVEVPANKVAEPTRASGEPEAEQRIKPKQATKGVKTAKWSREFQFGMNSTTLSAGAERRLRSNAIWLEQNPSASVTIEGHTDSVGYKAYNQELSERRANMARDFLLGIGVDESRITVVGKGELEPAVEPSTSARNRRIVLINN